MFKSYSNDFLYDSGFPTGLNSWKYRFFGVGVTLGVTFGVTILDTQKRKVFIGVTLGVTFHNKYVCDSCIYISYLFSVLSLFVSIT